ncbi:MAG: OadG family protein [Candidatus Eremiobacteraeota bacterium]|nr:OadG family protein [Candidatus Eremiobacteraeota bacterium]
MSFIHLTNILSILAQAADQSNKSGIQNIIDGQGPTLSIIGMSVVFSGLIVLFFVLFFLEKVINMGRRMLKKVSGLWRKDNGKEEIIRDKEGKRITGEEAAAICTALILYHRLHMDEQRQKITFGSTLRRLSPWALSGKVRQMKNR